MRETEQNQQTLKGPDLPKIQVEQLAVSNQEHVFEGSQHQAFGNGEAAIDDVREPLHRTPQDDLRDLRQLLPLALRGNAPALAMVFEAYFRGQLEELQIDSREIFRAVSAVAQTGYAPAMGHLAQCYFAGIGTEKNSKAVVRWTNLAVGRGDTQRMLQLALSGLINGSPWARDLLNLASANRSVVADLLSDCLEMLEKQGRKREAQLTAKLDEAANQRKRLREKHKRKIAARERKIAACEQKIAELRKQVEQHSPSAVEERAARLESQLREERRHVEDLRRALRGEERGRLEDARLAGDLERRVRYLERTLDKHGVQFNRVMRHREGRQG